MNILQKFPYTVYRNHASTLLYTIMGENMYYILVNIISRLVTYLAAWSSSESKVCPVMSKWEDLVSRRQEHTSRKVYIHRI